MRSGLTFKIAIKLGTILTWSVTRRYTNDNAKLNQKYDFYT